MNAKAYALKRLAYLDDLRNRLVENHKKLCQTHENCKALCEQTLTLANNPSKYFTTLAKLIQEWVAFDALVAQSEALEQEVNCLPNHA